MAEYIDREAFKKSVEEYYCKPCKAEGKDHNGCWCRACWVDDMLDEVDCFQPAANVAPVRHGRWIKESDGGTRCSVCNKRVRNVTGGLYEPVDLSDMPYCLKCGAKMDETVEENKE